VRAETPETRREALAGWLFVAPALLILAVFFGVPVIAGFLLGLTDVDLYALGSADSWRFVGLRNYGRLLEDPVFWHALRNTFVFVAAGVPLTIGAALGAALLLNARLTRFRGLFRTIYFAPVVTTLVAVASVWRYLYHPRAGPLNLVLSLVGIGPIDWLGDPRWAIPALVLMAAWKNFGYGMVLFVAGLQAIPESVYEAARIDGAGALTQFRRITLPLLAPTFLFVGVITTIGYFQLFAEPYVMTGGTGGPVNATLSVALLMYKRGFRFWDMGTGAAIAFVLFAIILGVSMLQVRLQRGRRA
jgi:multiple sugar transport system permease protein